MNIRKKIKDTPVVLLAALILLAIVLLYQLAIFLFKAFVYLGFNLFLFTDNLIRFQPIEPLFLWGVFGFFIGGIFGVIIAIKKYKLSKVLVLYPLSITLLCIIILSFINKPTDVSGTFVPVKTEDSFVLQQQQNTVVYYTVARTVYARSRPSLSSLKVFTIAKGTKVELLENVRDNRNKMWSRIEYTNPQTGYKKTGYMNANYLEKYNY